MERKPADQLLCDSLILWIFLGSSGRKSWKIIDPAWFDKTWLSRIKADAGDSWRIKASNLKKVLQGIMDYYHEFLTQQISEDLLPDLNQISEHSNPVELGRLLQLILGCAVNCEKKQEHIQVIMTLEESVQHVVMAAIQELMSKEILGFVASDISSDMEQQLKRAVEELNEVIAEKEELKQRCQELDLQVAALQEEKCSLMSENEIMNDRLDQLDGSFDDTNTAVAKKYFHAQLQLEQLQEENFRLETTKDDYRVHCEELEKQLIELQHRNDELTSLAEESRALKDEIDVLRTVADKTNKLESMVEVYRKKLQDLNDFRRQVKILQETNMMYMHNTVSLEEELKKANAARAQLETYKRQIQELHNKLSEESKRADALAFEMKQLEEKHETLIKEKERLIIQRDALKETNEELRYSQMQQDHLNQTGVSTMKSHENLAAEILPVEFREMFIRLQHENKMLHLQQEGSENEQIAGLQEKLEQKNRMINELETENREKLNEVHDELQKKEALLADLQPDLNQNGKVMFYPFHFLLQMWIFISTNITLGFLIIAQKIEELEAALHKKDEDMKSMEERYKMYLEKARTVIKTLDPKLKPASAEIMLLRKQLAEKEKRIETLEGQCKSARIQEHEEKLIVSAWYNQSLAFHKLGMESRLLSGNTIYRDGHPYPPAQSFLAQQRQLTNSRRNPSVKAPPTSSD
ncbi:Protein Hook-like 1 [Ophiophagus hannah]|uniref:Protein Hook-like 1 n=1 Tax=Ophiophagus hannah TaxID=8665 RepID=V8NZ00_OPHHA|nr:Protein Hook-like 1 [Ophiophagus hannah]